MLYKLFGEGHNEEIVDETLGDRGRLRAVPDQDPTQQIGEPGCCCQEGPNHGDPRQEPPGLVEEAIAAIDIHADHQPGCDGHAQQTDEMTCNRPGRKVPSDQIEMEHRQEREACQPDLRQVGPELANDPDVQISAGDQPVCVGFGQGGLPLQCYRP